MTKIELLSIGRTLVENINYLQKTEEITKVEGDMLANGEIALAINTSDEASSKDDTDKIRTQVLRNNVPYFTTIEAARVAISAISEIKKINPNLTKPLQDYLSE